MFLRLLAGSAIASAILVVITVWTRSLKPKGSQPPEGKLGPDKVVSEEDAKLVATLELSLSEGTVLRPQDAALKHAPVRYWAQQEAQASPSCVLRPANTQDLCSAVKVLKHEYDDRRQRLAHNKSGAKGLFAIHGGGHSPVPGAASINGGVLIDLALFNETSISNDRSTVTIGAGARWGDVSRALTEKGLAIVGGRNSDVGVGGFTLGGGFSFFSPRYGLVCSNIDSYEIVLADGSATTASRSTNPTLWRALKGGSNNFGIVTSFTVRSFPSSNIWSGYLYMPSFQSAKVLSAFRDSVSKGYSEDPRNTSYDENAAGPIISFSHVHAIGLEIIGVNLVYTTQASDSKPWPEYWRTSPFSSMWRYWSTFKTQSLASATDELRSLNPPGRRQMFCTTTVKNDQATLTAAYKRYREGVASIQRDSIKGLVLTLVMQPLLPDWARKGDENALGLDEGSREPLVIVSFSVNWDESKDDELVKGTTRDILERIEAFAAENGTSHRWRYLCYSAEWQSPFEGYGNKNLAFLREVSQSYDPDGLFQRACNGGFKLGINYES